MGGWRRPSPERWLVRGGFHLAGLVAGLGVVVLVALAYFGFRTTVPYDPLASAPQGAGAAMAGIEPGTTYTAIVPITTPSGERATLISATPASNTGARFVSVTGLTSNPGGLIVRPGGPRVAASQSSTVAALHPISGLQFSPQNADVPWTHAWIAVTFRMERGGCVDLPKLRLRYAVGSTEFTRVTALSLRLSSARGARAAGSCI